MEYKRMDVYECENCTPLFAVEVGELFECCPYCGETSTEYLNTTEVTVRPKGYDPTEILSASGGRREVPHE